MARKQLIEYLDDLDGTEADEQIVFSLDGSDYEIDLSQTNGSTLRNAFAPYLEAGRRTGGRRRSTKARGNNDLQQIRDWARANGYTVADRGRISQTIVDTFAAS